MPRGVVPRQPARTGRQDKVRVERTVASAKAKQSQSAPKKDAAAKLKGPASSKAVARAAKPARGYNPIAPERVQEILKRLNDLYPDVVCALTHASAWELLVATILSAQSTDVNVNRVTPELFRKYPTVEAFAALTPEQLEPDVRSTGFFRNKSKSVVGAAKKIVAEFGGQVPDDIEKLLTLPGVARKTANVVLGSWFKKAVGVVVDTHVHRISRRLELTKENDPQKIEQDLMKIVPRERWILFSHQIIWHGRKLCIARAAILQRETSGAERLKLSDPEILDVMGKMIKQRQELLDIYEKAGRAELAAQEREEIEIISAYLPKRMSDIQAGEAISSLIKELEAATLKDMGRTMTALKERFAGRMDFSKASAIVKKLLGGGLTPLPSAWRPARDGMGH